MASEHESSECQWRRHPTLYLTDGTVVLLAENTLFRVYLGLLLFHSEVFRGMASLSEHQPPNQEMYDGCPLVRLSDDPVDMASFLGVLMGLHAFNPKKPTSFKWAAGILRISTKYMVALLRQQAINHFGRLIATKFEDAVPPANWRSVFGHNDSRIPNAFELVTLFRECQVMHFLPHAFYLACEDTYFFDIVCGAFQTPYRIHVSAEDKLIALRGYDQLQADRLEIFRNTVMSVAPMCECGDTLRMEWLSLGCHANTTDTSLPLHRWYWFSDLEPPSLNATGTEGELEDIIPCSMCKLLWLDLEEQARREVWDRLPQTFELAGWEELLRDEV